MITISVWFPTCGARPILVEIRIFAYERPAGDECRLAILGPNAVRACLARNIEEAIRKGRVGEREDERPTAQVGVDVHGLDGQALVGRSLELAAAIADRFARHFTTNHGLPCQVIATGLVEDGSVNKVGGFTDKLQLLLDLHAQGELAEQVLFFYPEQNGLDPSAAALLAQLKAAGIGCHGLDGLAMMRRRVHDLVPGMPGHATREIHGDHQTTLKQPFVGRQDLLAWLPTWAQTNYQDASVPRVLALRAIGGMGMTAVLERVVPSVPPLLRLFFWSFQQNRDPEQLVAALSHWLCGPGASLGQLETALDNEPGLIMIDALDVVQAHRAGDGTIGDLTDAPLSSLLRARAQARTGFRVLLTTGLSITDLEPWSGQGYAERSLPPLSDAQAEELLTHHRVSPAWRSDILRFASGHPLTLEVLAGLADGAVRAIIEDIEIDKAVDGAGQLDRLRGLLNRVLGSLAEGERDLLALVALYPRGLDLDTAVDIAADKGRTQVLFPKEASDLLRLLEMLTRRSLIHQTDGQRWICHPFLRDSAIQAPFRDARAKMIWRQIEWHSNKGQPSQAARIYSIVGGFEYFALHLSAWQAGGALVDSIIDATARVAEDTLDERARRRLQLDRARFLIGLGRLVEAEQALLCMLADAHADQVAAHAHFELAKIKRLRGDYRGAQSEIAGVRAIGSLPEVSPLADAVALACLLHAYLGEFDNADEHYKIAAETANRSPRADLWLAEYQLSCGTVPRAEQLALRSIQASEQRAWCCTVALGRVLLARIPRAAPPTPEWCLRQARGNCAGLAMLPDNAVHVDAELCLEYATTKLALEPPNPTLRQFVIDMIQQTGMRHYLGRAPRG